MVSYYLLPYPKILEQLEGYFNITDSTCIVMECGTSTDDLLSAERLKQGIFLYARMSLAITRSLKSESAGDITLRINADSDRPDSYSIVIDRKQITIEGGSSAGLRYGVETLLQIINQFKLDLPATEIHDWPDFPVRGLYHDVTRGQVPTLDTLKHIADLCVSYKINHLELYIEHSFLFRSMSEISAGFDPLTPEDILELDRYCTQRHIDLVPSISTFGHMYEILRTRSFHHLNELDIDAGDLPYSWYDRMAHYTLDASDPGSMELVSAMLDEYLPLFSSDYVNICCDETFDLGRGKNAGANRSELYIRHLTSVIELVRAKGRKVLFWGDMVLKYDDLLPMLPKDAIVLNWNYGPEPDETQTSRFAETGLTQYICPGIIAWSHFTARIEHAESNIRHMAEYGKKYNASGLLNTNWGDHGHLNLLGSSTHGLIMGASYSWNVDGTPAKEEYDKTFSIVAYNDRTATTGSLLRSLGDADPARIWLLDNKPFEEIRLAAEKIFTPDLLAQHYSVAKSVQRELEKLRASASSYVLDDYNEYVWSARAIAAVNQYLLCMLAPERIDADALAQEIERLYAEYAALWRKRSRESELHHIKEAFLRAARYIRENKPAGLKKR